MPAVDLVVESPISTSIRARQVCSMFDVPPTDRARIEWRGSVPIEDRPWSVGMIVGPSGCGKTSVMRQMFGEPPALTWSAPSVVDDVRGTVQQVTDAFGAVGFNTIPAWLRPHAVLSNGEKFRVDLARRLLEIEGVIVVDEFTSVVDRQVAQFGSHAVQKFIRRAGRQFVAVSCHYDIEEWLQPDWILEPATMSFQWRSVQRRPSLDAYVRRVPISVWSEFAPYHYLTRELHRSAQCFALCVGGRPVAFAGLLSSAGHVGVWRVSRIVTLPDWQGIGVGMALMNTLGAAFSATGKRLRISTRAVGFVRALDRSATWALDTARRHGSFSAVRGRSSRPVKQQGTRGGNSGTSFEYVGPTMEREQARALLAR